MKTSTLPPLKYLQWLNKGRQLSQHLDKSTNNFGLIRLAAALLVISDHSFGFLDKTSNPVSLLSHGVVGASSLALPVFFFLSGLLVTQSLHQSPSWKAFLWKRALRLYPAAWIAILAACFLIGPLVTTLELSRYFSSPLFYRYLSGCLLWKAYFTLPGVFEHSPIGNSVNGPLWTIPLEWKLYLGLLLIQVLRIPRKSWWMISFIACSMLFFIPHYPALHEALKPYLGKDFSFQGYFILTPAFLIGSLCYEYREKIHVRNYWPFLLVVILPLTLHTPFFPQIWMLAVPAMTLFFAVKGVIWTRKLTPHQDLSYSLYLFGFPVEQIVVNYLHPTGSWQLFLITLAVLLPLAACSWLLVESRALKLKGLVK